MIMRKGQFWVLLGFGLAIALTTLFDETTGQRGALNAALIGLSLLAAAALELSGLHHWMDVLQTALGMWLAASPFILAYSGSGHIVYSHVILGLMLVLFGRLRRRLDRKPSNTGS